MNTTQYYSEAHMVSARMPADTTQQQHSNRVFPVAFREMSTSARALAGKDWRDLATQWANLEVGRLWRDREDEQR